MTEHDSRQPIVDAEHLRLLSLGYVFSGVMTALFSLMGLLYAGIGLFMNHFFAGIAQDSAKPVDVPPEFVGTIIGVFGGVFFLVVAALALAKFWAASRIRQRRSRIAVQVIAAITCFGIPYGTVLGVCTFMVLGRNSVVGMFDSPIVAVGTSAD
ncbi:hypothetical protein [Dokdonella sp.]|uniref:hypothetical protein n=1 Tax=Dokdonella sp. TaxID=2291710 RepID=UPI003C56C697